MENETLQQIVESSTDIKAFIVNYVGTVKKPTDDEVTLEMVVDVMAQEFPEFLLAVAEENFVRGYQQAFADIDKADEIGK